MTPLLLVQTCHFDQLIWVARQQRNSEPGRPLHLLTAPHPHLDFYLKQFPLFDHVHIWPERPHDIDEVIAPLLAAGYGRLKLFAWQKAKKGLDINYDGQHHRLTLGRVTTSVFRSPHQPTREWIRFAGQFPYPDLGKSVLICESASSHFTRVAQDRVEKLTSGDRRIVRVAGETLWKQWRRLRREQFDSAIVLLTAEPHTFWKQALPLLLGVPRILIFADSGRLFELPRRSLAQLFLARYRHQIGTRNPASRVAFFQTEGPRYVEAALESLRHKKLFPEASILLCCRSGDAAILSQVPGVEAVLLYPDRRRPAALVDFRRRLRAFDPQICAALFTGQPVFRPAKLLFLVLGGRQLHVFNAALNLYRLTPRRLPLLFRRDELRPDLAAPRGRLLFVQTASTRETLEAIAIARRPEVARPTEVFVVCPPREAAAFEASPSVDRVLTYPAGWRRRLQFLRKLREIRPEAIAAIFTNQPIFRRQKLLYLLLPARSRLAFNRHLDCGFVSRRQIRRLLRTDQRSDRWGRRLLKALLYLPRYLYLVIWVTWMRYGPRYTPTREE